MRVKLTITSVLMLSSMTGPAFAQGAADQASSKMTRDPNEIVCERQEEIGSRLGGERVCKTRAQWAEERRVSRQDIDKAQTQRDLSHPQ